jgi:hypothetical protein
LAGQERILQGYLKPDLLIIDDMGMKLSWFTVNWNCGGAALASGGMHPAGQVAASCREGLSLECQSRSKEERAAPGWHAARTSVLAPGTALGSVLTGALSSAQVV